MRYETIDSLQIPKVGFGTWSIGGGNSPDPSLDDKSLAALTSALELGYTHFDTAENYADGHAEELLGKAVRESGIPRDQLFITSKVEANHLSYEALLRSCEASLKRLGMDYLDLYLIHWPPERGGVGEAFRALNQLVRERRVRHVGVSNFGLKLLQEAVALCESPLLTNQVPYSLPDRRYVQNGVLHYFQENSILLTAYTPLKHRFVAGHKGFRAMAERRGITPHQLALAWLVTQPRVITIPMSFNPQHQAENLSAGDILLSTDEMAELNRMF